MTCKEIQEKLLTDYYDDQLSDQEKKCIDLHLKECGACREFFEKVKESELSMTPSENMPEIASSVWDNLSESIDRQERVSSVGLWDRIAEWFPPSKVLVPIAVSIFVMVLITHQTPIPKRQDTQTAVSHIEETLHLFSVNGDGDASMSFESDLEMYFL